MIWQEDIMKELNCKEIQERCLEILRARGMMMWI